MFYGYQNKKYFTTLRRIGHLQIYCLSKNEKVNGFSRKKKSFWKKKMDRVH